MPSGSERQYACAFAYAGKGYVFGGIGNNVLNDLWRYDPTSNAWTQLSSKPGEGFSGASCFILNDTAVFLGGANSSTQASTQVWAYVISQDMWVRLSNFPYNGLWRATACNVNGIGYCMGGKDSTNHFNTKLYQYNSSSDTWSIINSSAVSARIYAASLSVLSQLVMVAGLDSAGTYHSDVQYYDFQNNVWVETMPHMPKARKGGMCFTNYFNLYYTTGIDSADNRLNETLKIERPTSINTTDADVQLMMYPQPAGEKLMFSEICNEVLVYDMLGEVVASIQQSNQLDLSKLSRGTYLVAAKIQAKPIRRTIMKL
jgi:N-acetylneuraminic acid mutarotase